MAAPTPGTTPGLPTARQRWRGACRRRRSMTRLRDGHRRRHRARRRVPRTRCTESPTKFLRLASYGRSTPLPFPMIICCQSTIESEFFSCFFFCLLLYLLPDTCCVCAANRPYTVVTGLPGAESPLPFVHRTPPLAAPPPQSLLLVEKRRVISAF